MTLIELGDTSTPPAGPGPRRPVPLSSLRRYGAGLAVALTLLAVTASAPAHPPDLRTLWSADYRGTAFQATDDTVYVVNEADNRSLEARDLRTGVSRWTARVPGQNGSFHALEAAGAVLVPTAHELLEFTGSDGSVQSVGVDRDTLALDPVTGATRWQRRGEVHQVTDDTVLLFSRDYRTNRLTELLLVGTADGGLRWSYRPAGATTLALVGPDDDHPEQLVAVDPDGRVTVLRYVDGAVLGGGRVPWWHPSGPSDDTWSNIIGGPHGDVVVARIRGRSAKIAAYDALSLRQRWQIDRTSTDPECDSGCTGGPYPCGALLCAGDTAGTTAYDPLSGTPRWVSEWEFLEPLGSGRLLAASNTDVRYAVLDGATGRVVADPRATSVAFDGAGHLMTLSPTQDPPNRFAVRTLDPQTGAMVLRGTIDPVTEGQYTLVDGLFVRVDLSGRLTVTDVG